MSEDILKLLMELFAVVGSKRADYRTERRKMEEDFLRLTLSQEKALEYLALYDTVMESFTNNDSNADDRIISLCEELSGVLAQRQKIVMVLKLIEFVFIDKKTHPEELRALEAVQHSLKVDDVEYKLLLDLITEPHFVNDLGLIISDDEHSLQDIRNLRKEDLQGIIRVAAIKSADMYFVRYEGASDLQLNGVAINDGRAYLFGPGSTIRGEQLSPIYYSDVVNCFLNEQLKQNVEYRVEGITFHFPDGKTGLHEINFLETAGTLVGIMGGSGAGKSTLLNVLNGNARPSTGKVIVNGLDLHDQRQQLEGVIGFVSQSDILMDDLTVFQNLFFNAELCFAGKSKDFIQEKVDGLLKDIGLYNIRHLKVGNPLDKIISGGQRKRLNIALELIREPAVLFLDEPTSGLSSSDSEMIIDLLKSLSLKGKLVFVVIHQPSSQIFKLFDKLLLLDQGGYPVYQGNPVDSIIYFKHATHRINPDIGECVCCGNVTPEQIFTIMEARLLDENGQQTGERRFSPKEWNEHYLEHNNPLPLPESTQQETFVNDYQKPGLIKQFSVFVKRDVLSKLNNRQYLFITLLEAPVLAILLGFLSRYQVPGQEYTFQDNRNMVAYVFMSVIVMLFLGLMVSAEEILRDRKIRQRERFLNLSKGAYMNSKIGILLFISALQSFLFVMIGNWIMGFQELYFDFWLMLFAVSLLSNALGLNISSAFKKAVTIYILIPFLIIPQLLLSGLLVKFEELNPQMASRSVVPMSGEIMATRWAFEGLCVQMYKNNSYEKPLFKLKQQKAVLGYQKNFWYMYMKELIQQNQKEPSAETEQLLHDEFIKAGIASNELPKSIYSDGIALKLLDRLRSSYNKEYRVAESALDAAYKNEDEELWAYRRSIYFNDRIAELVQNQDVITDRVYEEYGSLHSGQNSIYFDASPKRQLRAHFYAPRKHIGDKYYDTYYVNLVVILIMTLGLYFLLYFEVLERLIKRLSFSRKH